MKFALFFLATAFAAVSGEETWCRCAAFVSYERQEIMVYEAPEIPITSCADDVNVCKNQCKAELDTLTNHGDLWSLTQYGTTVGQEICSEMASHYFFYLQNKMVYGYYEVCGGAWQYSGAASQTRLCCEGGQHTHCVAREENVNAPFHPRRI